MDMLQARKPADSSRMRLPVIMVGYKTGPHRIIHVCETG
jgi:hypothetical protein